MTTTHAYQNCCNSDKVCLLLFDDFLMASFATGQSKLQVAVSGLCHLQLANILMHVPVIFWGKKSPICMDALL